MVENCYVTLGWIQRWCLIMIFPLVNKFPGIVVYYNNTLMCTLITHLPEGKKYGILAEETPCCFLSSDIILLLYTKWLPGYAPKGFSKMQMIFYRFSCPPLPIVYSTYCYTYVGLWDHIGDLGSSLIWTRWNFQVSQSEKKKW